MAPLRTSRTPVRARVRHRGPRPAAVACLTLSVLSACSGTADRLLSVTTPSRLGQDAYLVPQNAPLMTAGAIADFECALGGYVVSAGLTSGELVDATQTAARWSLDRRDFLTSDALYSTGTCIGLGTYTPINTARFTADQAYTYISGWTDVQVPSNRQRLVAQAALYAGYSLVLLGEGYCTGVIAGGPELTSAQVLDSAQARFTTAIAAAQAMPSSDTTSRTIVNAAHVGRARVRLDRGDKTGAAADAAPVPAGFVLNATADATNARRNNRVNSENNSARNVTVAPPYRALTVQGQPDRRVPVADSSQRLLADQTNRWYVQQKYLALTTPIPIATYVEAQLILAEATGGAQGVSILNALRARPGVALPPLTSAEAADFQNTVLEERRRELFLQGNRLYDIRRASLTLTPAPGTPYPKGGTYAAQTCYPLPDAERAANPNLH